MIVDVEVLEYEGRRSVCVTSQGGVVRLALTAFEADEMARKLHVCAKELRGPPRVPRFTDLS